MLVRSFSYSVAKSCKIIAAKSFLALIRLLLGAKEVAFVNLILHYLSVLEASDKKWQKPFLNFIKYSRA